MSMLKIKLFLLLVMYITVEAYGRESLLIRTKRKPFKEYDYIDDSLTETKTPKEDTKAIRAQRNILEDFTESLENPVDNIFDRLVEKHKRFIDDKKHDPFIKLKEFFEELKKRSVDDDNDEVLSSEDERKDTVTTRTGLEHALNILKNQSHGSYKQQQHKESENEDESNMKSVTQINPVNQTTDSLKRNDIVGENIPDNDNDNEMVSSGNSGSGDLETSGSAAESGDSSGSGSGISSTDDSTGTEDNDINKRTVDEDDFSQLFEKTSPKTEKRNKRELDDDEDEAIIPTSIERNKRELNEVTGNPDFEGLPESLATIRRENPRVQILNREAKDKHIPDIPLPFNHVKDIAANQIKAVEHVTKRETKDDVTTAVSKERVKQKRDTTTPIMFKEFKSVEKIRRSLGDERLKNVKIIDDKKAQSLFDIDEGDFLNQMKRDGIYFDARNKRYLISAKAENIKKSHEMVPSKHSSTQQKIEKKHHMKRDVSTVSKTTNEHFDNNPKVLQVQKNSTQNINSTNSNQTAVVKSNSYNSNPVSTQRRFNVDSTSGDVETTLKQRHVFIGNASLSIAKRSVADEDEKIHVTAHKSNHTIDKRDILSDDDPNIDYLMRYDGKPDEIEDRKQALANLKRQRSNIKAAEEVYKFARSVMDLVGDTEKKKTKRHVSEPPTPALTGVWSGLGTAPEFVPGLIKRDYESKTKTKNSSTEIQKRSLNVHVDTQNKEDLHKHIGKYRRDTEPLRIGFSMKDRITDHMDSNQKLDNKPVILSKRDEIPHDDMEDADDNDFHDLMDNVDKKIIRRDIHEQSESKHIELGSLGSMNMSPRKTKKREITSVIKTKQESVKPLEKSKRVSKREDIELNDRLLEKEVDHLTSDPVQDGKVVLAFDEVKELLPTRRFFSQDEENMLTPVGDVQDASFSTKRTSGTVDVDRELADSMVLSGDDNKRSKVLGLKATNIVYENNENTGDLRSDLKDAPLLTPKDTKLKKAQLFAQSDEVQQKQEQMRNWVNSNKDSEEMETDKQIQEVSDQLAESTAELEKMKLINKAVEESAYLAKKLEEKNSTNTDSVNAREEKFKKLQQDILQEQALYRNLLEKQHEQFENKIGNEEAKVVAQQNNSSNTTPNDSLYGDSSTTTATQQQQITPAIKQSLSTDSPFHATVNSPELEEIHFDKFGAQSNTSPKILSQQRIEERVHPALSNETFPEDVEMLSGTPGINNNNNNNNKSDSNGGLLSTAVESNTTLPSPPPTPSTTQQTTILTTTITTTTTATLSLVNATDISFPNNRSQQITTETTPQPEVMNTTTVTTTQQNINTTIQPQISNTTMNPIELSQIVNTTTSPSTILPIIANTTVISQENVESHFDRMHPVLNTTINTEGNNEMNQTLTNINKPTVNMTVKDTPNQSPAEPQVNINVTTVESRPFEPPKLQVKTGETTKTLSVSSGASVTTNITNTPDKVENGHTSNESAKQESIDNQQIDTVTYEKQTPVSTPLLSNQTSVVAVTSPTQDEKVVINKTKENLGFPLEIAYRPRVVLNVTKKKLEIEPRADGYVGCFIDHLVQGRDLPVRAGLPLVTPRTCRSACKSSGYKYAGLQYGYLCFCGNHYGKYDIVPDEECDTICSGNDSFTCGGLWRNEIFDTEHVNETYSGHVQYYMPPKVRTSMDENPGSVRSKIPSPTDTLAEKVKENINLLDQVHLSEQEDIAALERMKLNAMKRSNIGIVRSVGNYSDEDLMDAVAWQMKVGEAEQKDVQTLNHPSGLTPSSSTLASSAKTSTDHDDNDDDQLQAFRYLHSQSIDNEQPQHSPEQPLKIEPGTHLFRGEVMLQQPWYDDLAKPESTKYKILTANIEVALKNVFVNDTSFLKAEVLSLREDVSRTPHKTIADFTMTFLKNESTDTVTHKLIDSIMTTKKLDEMPAIPSSLRVKEYLHDSNAQAYIPKLLNGEFHLSKASPFDTKNIDNRNVVSPNTKQTVPTLSLNAAFNKLSKPQDLVNGNSFTAPLSPMVRTRILPVKTNGMEELSSYMNEQNVKMASAPETSRSLQMEQLRAQQQQQQQQRQQQPQLQQAVKAKKKVPYVLRMFFWKDMLARKKRENLQQNNAATIDELEKFKNNIREKQKVIHFSNGLPSIIRERRSQADEWPTVYKHDAQKKQYGIGELKRKKRFKPTLNDDSETNDYDKLFEDIDNNKTNVKRQLPNIVDNEKTSKKELVDGFLMSVDKKLS